MTEQAMNIRQAQRFDVAFRGRFAVAPASSGAVRFAPSSGARDGWIDADFVDMSQGGCGFMSPLFVPRGCHVRLQVLSVDGSKALIDGLACIQRVIMTDRRPAYLVGASFRGQTPEFREQVNALLAGLAGEVG